MKKYFAVTTFTKELKPEERTTTINIESVLYFRAYQNPANPEFTGYELFFGPEHTLLVKKDHWESILEIEFEQDEDAIAIMRQR